MNFLDLVVVAVAAGAGWVGYRMGFVRRATSWGGLALGIVVGIQQRSGGNLSEALGNLSRVLRERAEPTRSRSSTR